jgi:hypothetical protein
MGVGDQRYAPAALPSGKTLYPLYTRQVEPHGWSVRARKISSPPLFDPRTVQPVASRCTDYANPGPQSYKSYKISTWSDMCVYTRRETAVWDSSECRMPEVRQPCPIFMLPGQRSLKNEQLTN